MKEKKESTLTNIFVYLLIIIFIILIILPPLFRIFMNDSTANNQGTPTNNLTSATALTCKREVPVGTMIYNVTITSNYGNGILNKVTFTYDMPEVLDSNVVDNPILTEINNLRNTGLLEETTTDTRTSFVLTKEQKESNPTNTSLDAYFQPLEGQRTNLESIGYTCSTLTA